jgi:hypothetical protein
LFLQYKVATRLRRMTASQAQYLGVPYFRFTVKTDLTRNGACQHNTLCNLQQITSGGMAFVYDVAPAFETTIELSSHMRNGTLADNSIFVPPLTMGRVQPGTPHCFAYITSARVIAFSEPGEAVDGRYASAFTPLIDLQDEVERVRLSDRLEETFYKLREMVDVRADESYAGPASVAAVAATTDLQCIVVDLDGSA